MGKSLNSGQTFGSIEDHKLRNEILGLTADAAPYIALELPGSLSDFLDDLIIRAIERWAAR